MTDESKRPEQFTADVQMRLVIRESSYGEVGSAMDEINDALRKVLAKRELNARFDFVGFNTHPCKAAVMEQAISAQMYDDGPVPF